MPKLGVWTCSPCLAGGGETGGGGGSTRMFRFELVAPIVL